MHEQHRLNNVVFSFYGPPGSGKGTLARLCKERLGFEILSTGELCRKHITKKTDFGLKIDELLKVGHLVPDDLITDMVKEWLSDAIDIDKPIILDGYPRTLGQAQLFVDLIEKEDLGIDCTVVFFEIADEVIMQRLSDRLVCSNDDCQAIYSISSSPPRNKGVCDECGASLKRRNDDKIEVIKERLKRYPQDKKELEDFYASHGIAVESIEVGSKSIPEVFEEFSTRFSGNKTV